MSDVKSKIITVRARFEGDKTPEMQAKGYYNNIFYTIRVKQVGEGFKVKRADDSKNESVVEYVDFDIFTDNWQILNKFKI